MATRWGIPRRHLVRLSLWGLATALLLACNLPLTPPTPVPSSTLALQDAGIPAVPLPKPTPAPTQQPTATPLTCVQLLTPENGAQLKGGGKVTFSWEPMPDAARYWLEITLPTGKVVTFDTARASRDQYLEAFGLDGVYYWQVSALGHGGGLLCTSAPFVFERGR